MKILFFGDIVGKIGRKAMVKILPELKKEYEPDLVIANAENIETIFLVLTSDVYKRPKLSSRNI